MAALWAGWTFAEWSAQVQKGRLGRQAARQGNRKDRNQPATMRLLWKAWDRAKTRVDQASGYTAEDRARHIAAVRNFAADADVKLAPNQRAVLATVAALADMHQHTRPACPLHALEARTGLSRKAVRYALTRLCSTGLLTMARRGEWKGEGEAGGRATTYRLPTPDAMRAHRDPGFRTYVPQRATEPMCPKPAARTGQPSVEKAVKKSTKKTNSADPKEDPVTPQETADSGLPVHVPHQRATTSATPTTEEDDTVNLTDLARANAEINRLKDEIREDLRAELLAELLVELGLADRQSAPVRHLRPVDDRPAPPSMETAR